MTLEATLTKALMNALESTSVNHTGMPALGVRSIAAVATNRILAMRYPLSI